MALRSPSSTSPRDGPSDLPPADSSVPISQVGSSNEAEVDVGRNTGEEAAHLLAKLEKEGMKIDAKVASIIDDGLARIKAEAVREKSKKEKRVVIPLLSMIGSMAIGFVMAVECCADALCVEYVERELAKSRRFPWF